MDAEQRLIEDAESFQDELSEAEVEGFIERTLLALNLSHSKASPGSAGADTDDTSSLCSGGADRSQRSAPPSGG